MVASIERTQTTASATQPPRLDGAATPRSCKVTFVEQRQEVIDWLVENGYPALPVAPAQPAEKYPKINKESGAVELDKDGNPIPRFTGKNPSYLDKAGVPHSVFHTKYQDKLPTQQELNKWFSNPLNGVGTLGGWNNAVWIDFDVKNFDSEKECEDAALDCSEFIEEQFGTPFLEKTHSGGWRIGVSVEEAPSFTNFCIKENGKHIGEALFKGRFTVLAPTIGVSGNPYENVNRVKLPVVPNLEAIGIYPPNPKKEDNPILRAVAVNYNSTETTAGSIFLEKVCSQKSRDVLMGIDVQNNRDGSLIMAIKEWYGWMNWCADNNLPIYGSVEDLTYQAGRNLDIDDARILRIFNVVKDPSLCKPASYKNEENKGCWKIVRICNRKMFDEKCPTELKEVIKKDVAEYAKNKNAKSYPDSWEQQLSSNNNSKKKKKKDDIPSPRQLGLELAEDYQSLWTFHNEQKTWRIFNGKSWDEIEEEAFAQVVFNSIEAKGVEWEVPSYIDNVLKVLKHKLLVKKWISFDRKRYIAFSNKVLDNETGKLLDHSPGFRFTSYLPFDYNGLIDQSTDPLVQLSQNCPHIYDFFSRAMNGSLKKMRKLLAIINGAIKFRFFDLQMFVHLRGKPGTGKGTFARILNKLIGKANTRNSSLTSLGEGTEIAAIIDKQLVIFPDERKKVGVEEILKLVGGDGVRYREIYKKRGEGFFLGLLLILSNNPIFAGDTTGIDRRYCLIQFLNPIPKNLRTSKAEENYDKEIPALIRVALAMKDEDVTNLIKGINGEFIPEFKQEEWKMKCQVSSLAAWVNENVIYDLDEKTLVGDGRKNSERELNPETLFGNYLYYCEGANVHQTYHLNTFSSALIDLCTDTLEWEGIEKKRFNTGMYIIGLRLRDPNGSDDDIPTVEGGFENLIGEDQAKDSEGQVKGSEDRVKTYGEDLKPLQNKDSEGSEDQNPIKFCQKNLTEASSPVDYTQINLPTEKEGELLEKNGNLAFTPSPSLQHKGFQPSPGSSPSLHQPSPSLHHSLETPFDFSDFIARSKIELARLDWTTQQGKEYLLQTYGKRSRQLLSDTECVEFLAYLEAQPTPQQENSSGIEEKKMPEQVDVVAAEPVEEPRMVLPQETDEIETAAELEYSPAQYSIHLSENDSEWGCTFVQKIGNICHFEGREDELIDIEVDEEGKFVGGLIVKKME